MIKVKLDAGAVKPTRAHEMDAGLDLYMPTDYPEVMFDQSVTINTGVHVEIPEGYVGLIKSRSGMNIHRNMVCEGVIDAGYVGSICVKIRNLGNEPRILKGGDRIAQLVIVPCLTEEAVVVEQLGESERGDRGFGSSGR